jgi:large subunit ribosomal protein L17
LFRNLVTALLEHEQIRTTDPKAKEVRRLTDRVITLGKRGSLHARRRAAAFVQKSSVVKKLFDEVAPRFANRAGGYTRVIKVGSRVGDAAQESIVELTERGAAAEPQGERPKSGAKGGAKTGAKRGPRAGARGAAATGAPKRQRKPRKAAE